MLQPQVVLDSSALDPAFKAHALRGTGRYVSQLEKHLRSHTSKQFHFSSQSLYGRTKGTFVHKLCSFLPAGKLTVSNQIVLPRLIKSLDIDLVHFPAHIDAPAFTNVPYVVTVLDLIPLIFSDHYKPPHYSWRFRFARWLELQAIIKAQRIIAISENTKQDIVNILGVDENKIDVTPLGVDESFFIEQPRQLSRSALIERYSLQDNVRILSYIGGIDWRKNITTLLQALHELTRQHSQEPVFLFLAGHIKDDDRYAELSTEIRRLDLQDRIIETGFLSDVELKDLLRGSDIFVFPSLYEGFGLPVLEAMASGTPVVAANTSSIPEVVSSNAPLFEAHSADELCEKLLMVLKNDEFAELLSNQGVEQAKRFSWRSTASKTEACYLKCLGEKQ